MFLVILYHSCVYWTGTWFDKEPMISCQTLSIFAKWLNSFHIYGFVFASGYLYSFGRNELGKYRDKKKFLAKKAKRLLIPFYFVALAWVMPLQQLFFHNNVSIVVKDYIMANNPNQLWFLWMLFIVFTVTCILIEIIDKSLIAAVAISVGGYGLYLVLLGRFPNCFQIIMAMQYLSIFIAGYYIRKAGFSKIPWFVWLITDIALFSLYEYVPSGEHILRFIHYGIGFVLHIVGAIMAWTTLQALANKVNWKDNKTFNTLSSYSMPMYLFHQQIIYFTITWLNGRVNPWLHAGLNFIVTFIGSILISALLMHWKNTRFLIGEK